MNTLDINDLSFSSKAQICWGFFWRGIAITIASTLCSALIGGITGVVLALIGAPKGAVTIIGGVLGLSCGMYFIYLLVLWLLTTRIGNFKLVLTHAEEEI